MKKQLFIILSLALVVGVVGCKSEVDDTKAAKVEEVKADGDMAKKDDGVAKEGMDKKDGDMAKKEGGDMAAGATYKIEESSTIGFIGAKVTGDHKGGFKKFDGMAKVEGDKLTALEVTVDTTSVWTDAEKLTGHLQSPDFFDVAKFPKASFKMSKAEAVTGKEGVTHSVTGELDLHGVKKQVTFDAMVKIDGDMIAAKADFKVNRKLFGIVYAGKPDDLIKDDVALNLDLKFKKG